MINLRVLIQEEYLALPGHKLLELVIRVILQIVISPENPSSVMFCFVTYWHSRPLQDTRQPEKEDVTYYLNCI